MSALLPPSLRPDVAADAAPPGDTSTGEMRVILSFDIEEHHRIEAAVGLAVDPRLKQHYSQRVGDSTRWLLDRLDERGIAATFFIVGEIARDDPALIRAIQETGHEVASHGWDHRRITRMSPEEFREDVRRSKDALEQVTGAAVVGYRAPTFSIMRRTAWALDVLTELGLLYDSSIFPVRHDRYGVPHAPRTPFLARGLAREIIEIPPATLRLGNINLPAGGGGYFRLFPPSFLESALRQARLASRPPVAMLYFHPWEFDPDQPRLPLGRLSRWRTYVGIGRSRNRLVRLISRHQFARAVDVARRLRQEVHQLPSFAVSAAAGAQDS